MREVTAELITLVKGKSPMMHSPFYSNPCHETCEVCNMDKGLYKKIRNQIEIWDRLKENQ